MILMSCFYPVAYIYPLKARNMKLFPGNTNLLKMENLINHQTNLLKKIY